MKLTRLLKPATIDTEEQLHKLEYPLLVFPKYDGIRCAVSHGHTLTNTLKRIPNHFIRKTLEQYNTGSGLLDGEIVRFDTKDFHKVQSIVMSEEHLEEAQFRYMMFDRVIADECYKMSYGQRLDWLTSLTRNIICLPHLLRAPHTLVENTSQLLTAESIYTNAGFEGIVIRSLDGPYKMGRSTLREGICLKLKRTEDAEARIISCNELLHNENEAETDRRGLTKRSSHKDNKVGSGMLGSFHCIGINGKFKGKEFDVSAGSMTHGWRRNHWQWYINSTVYNVDDKITDKIITFTYAKHRGKEDGLPAEPRFKAFRSEIDL